MFGALMTLLLAAGPLKVAVMPLAPGDGVADKTAQSVTDAVCAELRHNPGLQIMTAQELNAVLGVERQRQMIGCQNDTCMAEVAGALDADRIVLGNVAKLGQSWMVHLQLVDARKVQTVGTSDRRKKGGTIDDVLDALPEMAKELFGAPPAATSVVPPSAPVSTAPPPSAVRAQAPPPPFQVERPYTDEIDRSKLQFVEDGAGHAFAFVWPGGIPKLIFYGSGPAFYLQLQRSGGAEGNKRFNVDFWEPRAHSPSQASFDFLDGAYSVTCGKKKIPFTPVPEAKAKAWRKDAKLMAMHWARMAYALARDDEGNYYYVDQARDAEEDKDLRVYLGTEGQMTPLDTHVVANDRSGDVFATPQGKLLLTHGAQEAEWSTPSGKVKLKALDPGDNARLIYGKLGVYAKQALGTPCDGLF
jgi:hypothetical protein